jgi:hypothetical protein
MVFEALSADIAVWTNALVAWLPSAAQFTRGNVRWFAEGLISWFAIGFIAGRIHGLNPCAAGGAILGLGRKLVQQIGLELLA